MFFLSLLKVFKQKLTNGMLHKEKTLQRSSIQTMNILISSYNITAILLTITILSYGQMPHIFHLITAILLALIGLYQKKNMPLFAAIAITCSTLITALLLIINHNHHYQLFILPLLFFQAAFVINNPLLAILSSLSLLAISDPQTMNHLITLQTNPGPLSSWLILCLFTPWLLTLLTLRRLPHPILQTFNTSTYTLLLSVLLLSSFIGIKLSDLIITPPFSLLISLIFYFSCAASLYYASPLPKSANPDYYWRITTLFISLQILIKFFLFFGINWITSTILTLLSFNLTLLAHHPLSDLSTKDPSSS